MEEHVHFIVRIRGRQPTGLQGGAVRSELKQHWTRASFRALVLPPKLHTRMWGGRQKMYFVSSLVCSWNSLWTPTARSRSGCKITAALLEVARVWESLHRLVFWRCVLGHLCRVICKSHCSIDFDRDVWRFILSSLINKIAFSYLYRAIWYTWCVMWSTTHDNPFNFKALTNLFT